MAKTTNQGTFIAFEGGEGAGKSTQIRRLESWLAGMGARVKVTREPGGTEIGKNIRTLLLDPRNRHLSPRAEALLYQADRAQHVAEVINPSLSSGMWVLTDRYFYSSVVYQGVSRKLGTADILKLSAFAVDKVLPELVFLLDVPAEVGLARLPGRGQRDRMELEDLSFHQNVRKGFRALAKKDPKRFVVLDATKAEEALSEEIQKIVTRKLAARVKRLEAGVWR